MNSFLTWLSQFLLEILAVFVAIELSNRWSKYWENKHKLDLTCDSCHKPLKLRRSKDKKFWLCYACIKLYRAELRAQKQFQTEQANPGA